MKKKTINIGTIKANEIKVATGHPTLDFRTGVHKPRNQRRQNTRANQSRKAIQDNS